MISNRRDEENRPMEDVAPDIILEPLDERQAVEEDIGDIDILRSKLKKIKSELDACRKERSEYLDGWQRCKADSINARRDAITEGLRTSNKARDALAEAILPALDSFDMAISGKGWLDMNASWRAGMENVRSQLANALANVGFESFGAAGEDFDSKLHEAMQEIAGEGKPGTIARVLRKGYRISERVVRPAQVAIIAHK